MKYKLSAALLGAACTHAYANETLPDIVVTATRTAQTAYATLASVSIITRQDITRQQAQSLPDVLRGVAGLTLRHNGGAGKATSGAVRQRPAPHRFRIFPWRKSNVLKSCAARAPACTARKRSAA